MVCLLPKGEILIKEIIVLSRLEAELLCYGLGSTPKNKWVLISICSPKEEMIKDGYVKSQLKKWGCADCLSLTFDDITKENYERIKVKFSNTKTFSGIKMFSKKDAQLIIDFIKKHKDGDEETTLIVHCTAGVSRSGATGWFACKYLELDKNNFLQQNKNLYPNKYILEMLESMAGMIPTGKEEYENNFKVIDF